MDPMKFLDILDGSLSEAELSTLCRQFNAAFLAFPGSTKREKTREFLGYIRRMGRMASLAEAMVALRPDLSPEVSSLFVEKDEELDWLDQVAAGEGRAMDSGLTWRWASSSSAAREKPAPAEPDGTAELLPRIEVTNPYTPGRIVKVEEMFFGRAEERRAIQQLLDGGSHVAIVSARDFGGSSLLYRLAQRKADTSRALPAYIDMKDATHHTVTGMLDSAWKQWWALLKPERAASIRTLADFLTAVRKLNQAGFRPLLFIDELEQLVWRSMTFDDSLLDAWLELAQEGLIGFALTSHSPLGELFAQGDYQSRFFELFQQVNVGLLESSAARDMLTLPSRRLGLEVPDSVVEYFISRAGPHPFFLQIAGHYLFDSLVHQAYSRSEVNKCFTTAAEPFWQEIWDSLTPLAQTYYPTVRALPAEGMAGRQLRIMANRGLVIVDKAGYHPFSEGFADWVDRVRASMEAAAAAEAGVAPA